MIFGIAFGYAGIIIPITILRDGNPQKVPLLFFLPFALVGIGALFIVIRQIYRAVIIATKAKTITGVVQGYRPNNARYNGVPGSVAKIAISTKNGPRILLYDLGSPARPFAVGRNVDVKVYKNYYKVDARKGDDVWKNV